MLNTTITFSQRYQLVFGMDKRGGYNFEFLSTPPDRVVCSICHLPCRDPYITECCGHVMCKLCPGQSTPPQACPICRSKNYKIFVNKQIDREVHNLKVFCSNKERGCMWNGKIKEMQNHLESCDYEMVQCNYHDVGCKVKVCRKRKREHDDEHVKDHLEMTKSKLAVTEQELELTNDRLTSLELVIHQFMNPQQRTVRHQQEPSWFMKLAAAEAKTGIPKCPCIIKISDFTKLKSGNDNFVSNFFTKKGYLIQICVDIGGPNDHLFVQLCVMKGPYDDDLTWPMVEQVEVALLNQITDDNHCIQTFSFDSDQGSRVLDEEANELERAVECYPFIEDSDLTFVCPSSMYLKDDSIFLGCKTYDQQ